jgi:hypothetical protein
MFRQAMLCAKVLARRRVAGDMGFDAAKQVFGFHRNQQAAARRSQRREFAKCGCQGDIAYQIGKFVTIELSMFALRFAFYSLLAAALAAAPPATAPHKPKLVLAIAIDQFRYDFLTRYRANTGGLNWLLTKGAVFTDANYEQAPTVTPSDTAFLSGTFRASVALPATRDRPRIARLSPVCRTIRSNCWAGRAKAARRPADCW